MDSEKFVLRPHMIDFFNSNAERFNTPESEIKVFQRIPYAVRADGTPARDLTGFAAYETLELPVMENPKYFFSYFRNERLAVLFECCPESAAKLGTRPWKYILRTSPEFADQCPCLQEFSEEEKAVFLDLHPELNKFFQAKG